MGWDNRDIERAIQQLQDRLGKLLEKRLCLETELKEVTVEAEAIHKSLHHLWPLLGVTTGPDAESVAGLGLTDAIRNVLGRSPKEWLSAMQVRDQLEKRGFLFSGYTMPMASVYTTLKRLCKKHEIEAKKEEGNRYFKGK